MTDNIDFSGAWEGVWNSLSTDAQGLLSILSIVGVLLVVLGLFKMFLQRTRGGGNSSALWWTILVGAILCAPNVILPLLLTLIDSLANMVTDISDGATSPDPPGPTQ